MTIRKEGAPDQTSVIEAPSRFAVYDQVQKDGGFVVELKEDEAGFKTPAWLNISFGTGVKRSEIIRMAKNLSAMLAAGLSLSRALSVIERQSGNKHLKTIVMGLSGSIKKGSSFHEALSEYPHVFPSLFVAMVRAGEESGSLEEALTVVALQMERSEELVRKIRGAMIYPTIVITAIVIVGILMLMFVVPTLTKTFAELGVPVPLATQVIVSLSNFMVGNAVFVLVGLVVLVVGGIAFVRSRRGSGVVLSIALRLPVVGELVRETYTARAARTLSSLLSSGVPVLDALSITKDVVHADVFANVVAEAEQRVKKGELLSAPFSEHTKLYPVLMSEMLSVGEETGKVALMLKQIAEFYETDVGEKTKDLSTIIEPVLMLLIGVVVGIFAVAMIQPIYSLSSAF
ncbi:MAG: type II secretion system F family protein [Patescibacteria group bacterium]|nr:type II secretion system F family protein [Patescibacteria group bacterium]MDE2173355.1 type II secretion system F family protein [Patescibacteria group bacterium]